MAKLQFAVRRPNGYWRPPTTLPTAKIRWEAIGVNQMESRLSFKPVTPQLAGIHQKNSYLVQPFETYFGKFGAGSHITYTYQSADHVIDIVQHPVLESTYPLTFLYPDKIVSATLTSLRGESAVVVRPLRSDLPLRPFINVSLGETWVRLAYSWNATADEMLRIADALI